MSKHTEEDRNPLVFGLVGPVGIEWDGIIGLVKSRLEGFGYDVEQLKMLYRKPRPRDKKLAQTDHPKCSDQCIDALAKMNLGDDLCEQEPSALAERVVTEINKRATGRRKSTRPKAFIVKSLKRVSEHHRFREEYGRRFFLLGFHCPDEVRRSRLQQKPMTEADATLLMERDSRDKSNDSGQDTSSTFPLADAFFSASPGFNEEQIDRFLDLLFQNQFITPTRDEYAMFMAHAAAARSGCLARQVGAVIVDEFGDVLAAGTNDAPRAGGGLHWDDAEDARDIKKGYDANKRELRRLAQGNTTLPEGGWNDVIEFMREVHAEMSAILCCARNGISVKGKDLYCTTLPCHCCAKEIICAGIKRVIFVEPYPKSKALHLHDDAISMRDESNHVLFTHFVGVGARRYLEFFSLGLGSWNHAEVSGLSRDDQVLYGKAKNKRKNDQGDKLQILAKQKRRPRYTL